MRASVRVWAIHISRVIGIQKALHHREWPSRQLFDGMGEFCTTGGEFGVNTGRPRRCGTTVLARQAVRINGFTDLFITKLDVLTGLDRSDLRGLRC